MINENDKKKLQRKKNAIVQLTSKTTGANIRKALIEKEVALILMIIPRSSHLCNGNRIYSDSKTQV